MIGRAGQAVAVLFGMSVLVFLIFFAAPAVTRRLASPAVGPAPTRWRPCVRSSGSIAPCRCNMR